MEVDECLVDLAHRTQSVSQCLFRLALLCELGNESLGCLENILLQKLDGSTAFYLR